MITRACKASPDWMRIGAVPGVLAGIVVNLAATNTTLNIESFMGSIMCLGVSVSNSVMLVTFINDYWKGGFSSSDGGGGGRRPLASDPDDGLRDDGDYWCQSFFVEKKTDTNNRYFEKW